MSAVLPVNRQLIAIDSIISCFNVYVTKQQDTDCFSYSCTCRFHQVRVSYAHCGEGKGIDKKMLHPIEYRWFPVATQLTV
jgi:hypothetical protein